MNIRTTSIRKIAAASALGAMAVFGVAACSNDDAKNDTAQSSAPAASDTAASSAAPSSQGTSHSDDNAAALTAPEAQKILRAIVDPKTSPAEKAKLVDEDDDPNIGATLQTFAQNAGRGGYTPEAFTVTAVEKVDDDDAIAKVSVKSPHAPAPVNVDYKFTHDDGTWKLSDDATQALLKMGKR